MNRHLLPALAAIALAASYGPVPRARADRLGGNYRGPADQYVLREDAPPPPPALEPGEGEKKAPPSEEAGEEGPDRNSAGEVSGEGDSESGAPPPPAPHGGSGGYRGPSGEGGGDTPPDGGGGGESAPEGREPSDPETGGGGTESAGDAGGESPAGGSSSPPPAEGGAGDGSGPDSGASGASFSGRGRQQDDKDRTWPFYFEGAREEYFAAVLARRPAARLSPPGTSTWILSTQPEPPGDRRAIGETDRREAMALALERLADADSHVRDAAILALGKGGFAGSIPHILRIAEEDPDPAVREDALLALGLTGRLVTAGPPLLRALTTPPSDRRDRRPAFAALGLGLLGDRDFAAEPLRRFYRASISRPGWEEDAAAAAVALGMLADPEAIPLFEMVLASRVSPDALRCWAAFALGKYGTSSGEPARREALRVLLAVLEGRGTEVRRSALLALGSFDEPAALQALLREGLGKADSYARNFAAHALGRIAVRLGPGSRAFALIERELAKVSASELKDRWLFQAGTLSLATLGSGGQEAALLGYAPDLRKLEVQTAASVVLSLGLLGTESGPSAEVLTSVFESRSYGTVTQAYAGLGLAMGGESGAAETLHRALVANAPIPADTARAAVLGIGLAGGAAEAETLVGVLAGEVAPQQADSSRIFLKGAAVQALGLIGDAGTVERLKPLLRSRDWEQRAFAVAALGYLMEPHAEDRVAPRISGIFRHHNYRVALPLVRTVQGTL